MDCNDTFHHFRNSASRRALATIALYVFFICGGLWNALNGSQSILRGLTPVIIIAVAAAAFLLTYRFTIRSVGAALAVILMTFIAVASGVNFGFPFGDFAFTNALGPKLLDVPLAIPFLWLALLITSWIAADRILRYKHIVVAAIVATAFDAVLEFAADSLDLWHWQGGRPTELNFISWFATACLGISLLKRYAMEKEADPIVPHLLIAQLLYFFITDVGIRFFSSQA
jgi:uncharacterized membrane protein